MFTALEETRSTSESDTQSLRFPLFTPPEPSRIHDVTRIHTVLCDFDANG